MPTELPKQTAANKLFNVFASAVAASKKGGGGEFDGERCVGHHTLERAPRSLVLPRTRSLLGLGLAARVRAQTQPWWRAPTARSLSATTKPRASMRPTAGSRRAPSISVRLRLLSRRGSGAAHGSRACRRALR